MKDFAYYIRFFRTGAPSYDDPWLRHEIFLPLHDVRLRTGSFRPCEKSAVRPAMPRDVVSREILE
jgi:hypothetical protein